MDSLAGALVTIGSDRRGAAGGQSARPPSPGLKWFRQFHRSIGLNVTRTCPLSCAHCTVESGPFAKGRLDRQEIVRWVTDAAASGHLKRLNASGGEPFLERATLKALAAVARRYSVDLDVITAAHWAHSYDAALAALSELQGLTTLSVSADEYHEPFVPLENVVNALSAARTLSIAPVLVLRTWRRHEDPFEARIREAIGDELWAGIHIDHEMIDTVGRGALLTPPEGADALSVANKATGHCPLASQPVVDFDGVVAACCNVARARDNPVLRLGTIDRDALADMSKRADGDPILQTLRVFGPARLADLLAEEGLAPATGCKGICELCTAVTGDPAAVEILRRRTTDQAYLQELALARMIALGEPSPWTRIATSAAPPAGPAS
jgi:hypothetical protein